MCTNSKKSQTANTHSIFYRRWLMFTLFRIIQNSGRETASTSTAKNWITILTASIHLLPKKDAHMLLACIALLQRMRKRLKESEISTELKKLSNSMISYINGEPIAADPSYPAGPDGLPHILGPWKKSANIAEKKGMVWATWKLMESLTPDIPDGEITKVTSTLIVAFTANLNTANELTKKAQKDKAPQSKPVKTQKTKTERKGTDRDQTKSKSSKKNLKFPK